jgi:predicted nucleic acid-binding protein
MILYLDSSSLLKLYLEEPHSELVRQAVRDVASLATSRIAYPEVTSALTRRRREGYIDPSGLEEILRAVSDDWLDLWRIEVDEQAAAALTRRYPLRGCEAIHLAAAAGLAAASEAGTVVFCSFDARQLAAARSEGLTVLGPGPEDADLGENS